MGNMSRLKCRGCWVVGMGMLDMDIWRPRSWQAIEVHLSTTCIATQISASSPKAGRWPLFGCKRDAGGNGGGGGWWRNLGETRRCSKCSILNEEPKPYLQVKLFPPLCTQREMGLRQVKGAKDWSGWVHGGLKHRSS